MYLKQKSKLQRKVRATKFLADAVSYRIPRQVTQRNVLQNGDSYPICPRCNISIEREYMSFCDRCGQRLSWLLYPNAGIQSAGQK